MVGRIGHCRDIATRTFTSKLFDFRIPRLIFPRLISDNSKIILELLSKFCAVISIWLQGTGRVLGYLIFIELSFMMVLGYFYFFLAHLNTKL